MNKLQISTENPFFLSSGLKSSDITSWLGTFPSTDTRHLASRKALATNEARMEERNAIGGRLLATGIQLQIVDAL